MRAFLLLFAFFISFLGFSIDNDNCADATALAV